VTNARIPFRDVLLYSLPAAVVNYTFMLVGIYLLKFSTDVLLLAPGLMGLVFGASRIWDAISDPLAGHWSDRTRSKLGRRRSWLLGAVLPIGLAYWMVWSPPAELEGGLLLGWMTLAVFAYFTATTIFNVPHESWGAELSSDYDDRTRIFGVRHVVGALGSLCGLGGMALLRTAEDPRAVATSQALVAAGLVAVLILVAVGSVGERRDHQGRGGSSLRAAFSDVRHNPHARLLLFVYFVENFGTAVLAVLVPFVMQYVLAAPDLMEVFMALYFVPAILSVPIWINLSRRFGKKPLWIASMSAMTFAFGGMFFATEGDVVLLSSLALLAGLGGGCGQVVGPSIQADVIDWDEHRTGERKEGAYFAVWNFVRKSAFGLAAMLAGGLLQVLGFEPNAEQSEGVKIGMRALFIGTLAFLRFGLNQEEHAALRLELERRERAARD
jgi:GPH family glycoside/pentoside/hexuronide:cation symporter